MPKSRKRKQPVTDPLNVSDARISGHHLIRKFHVLLKREEQLLAAVASASVSHELDDVQNEIERLGGLGVYQKVSAQGQNEERGGGSEKIFVNWLKEIGARARRGMDKERLRLLEVGAVRHDNFASHAAWIDCTPIDLRSRHPKIQEQDFLKLDVPSHCARWDAISLSLVINFVPNSHDRGRMLSLAYDFLREEGFLFLALPLPCVANSRYLDFDSLKRLMRALGYNMVKERWKSGGKMAYWLFQKGTPDAECRKHFKRKGVLRAGKNRNNFSILLP